MYDALYGTDVIDDEGDEKRTAAYNPVRGEKVISYARQFLDQAEPLDKGSHEDSLHYLIADGRLSVSLSSGETTGLKDASKLVGYRGNPENPSSILLKNNGLHLEIQIDRSHPIGQIDREA